MDLHERQQGAPTYTWSTEDLLENAQSTQLQPMIESPKRNVSVFLCHWDTDVEAYPQIRSGIQSLQRIFEHDYGFMTKVHELDHERSGSQNQLTLMSRFMPLLYDTSPDPEVPCRCPEGMQRYLNKPKEVDLFTFFYIGYAETASDGSCLLRPIGQQPGQEHSVSATLPSVNFSSVSRATLDMGGSQVLTLLDCPYDGPSTAMVGSTNKELLAAGSALWKTPSFEFTTHLVHHIRQAARQERILNTHLLFSRLAGTLSAPPVKAIGGVEDTPQPRPAPSFISLAPIDSKGKRYGDLPVERRWQPMDVNDPIVGEGTAGLVTGNEGITPLPNVERKKKKHSHRDRESKEKGGFPSPRKPKFRLGENSKSGLRDLLQGMEKNK
ncbi:hypothetical protein PG995_016118 [Apiospora arundinis]